MAGSNRGIAAGRRAAVIGAGPAGLMAAEILASAGVRVTVYDRMANPGRKLLMAGRGGLNLTHSEPLPDFLARYGEAADLLRPAIEAFAPDALRAWCEGLGQPTFVGTSGRVFPRALKASPLLRAWFARLNGFGVRFRPGARWTGWTADGALAFDPPDGGLEEVPRATVLALGGASWPRLGSDGGWVPVLQRRGIGVAALTAANCGVRIGWSAYMRERFAGEPLKRIVAAVGGHSARGEAVVTARGLEGGALYQLVPAIRRELARTGTCAIAIDLRPDLDEARLAAALAKPIGKQSLANHLRKAAGLAPVSIALLREGAGATLPQGAAELARLIKAVPLAVAGLEPIERAISSAGGIVWDEIGPGFGLKRLPGVFAAGEMLDWEAPTGGYLLQACFSTGVAAAKGALACIA